MMMTTTEKKRIKAMSETPRRTDERTAGRQRATADGRTDGDGRRKTDGREATHGGRTTEWCRQKYK